LVITINGKTYDDWYLPAAKELAAIVKSSEPFFSSASKVANNAYFNEGVTNATLKNANLHYDNKPLINKSTQSRVSGFPTSGAYFSATENSSTYAWRQLIHIGAQNGSIKTGSSSVRCVRRFD